MGFISHTHGPDHMDRGGENTMPDDPDDHMDREGEKTNPPDDPDDPD
jgi:hypothetical protein